MSTDDQHRDDGGSEEPFVNDGPTDRSEGRYTELDGEDVTERTVHGQYTRTETDHGPETQGEGGYTDKDGEGPQHSTNERQGKFNRHDQ